MKAFISITPKSHKNGQIYINSNVKTLQDCINWFDINKEYFMNVAKRRSIERVDMYVTDNFDTIYSRTI